MALTDLLIDVWSTLQYKPAWREALHTAPTWCPENERRRLTAYTVLAAYDRNQAGELLSGDGHREYGDPSLIVDQTLAHLLGEQQQVTVPGAENEPDGPLAEREKMLRQWTLDEHLLLRLQETERNAVLLGDGVYLVSLDTARKRPRLRAIDPGFYFPVLGDGPEDGFPTRVHFAWEIPGDTQRGTKRTLRRITYELGPIQTPAPAGGTKVWRRSPNPGDEGEPQLAPGDRLDPEGRVWRAYPWSENPSPLTCYLTDAEWALDDAHGTALDDLSLAKARFRTNADGQVLNRLDLRLDFLPVIHLPNTVAGAEHFGQSSLAKLLQLLDDIAAADTDSQRASATTGSPIIGMTGTRLPLDPVTRTPQQLSLEPGAVWQLGEQGSLHTVDTTSQLAELRAYVQTLRERLAVNSRIPASILGSLPPHQVPSGIALRLSFAPLEAMIRSMRLVRAAKYPLLLKFVQRVAQAGGLLPAGPTPPAQLTLGPYLPLDQKEIVEQVATAVRARIISLETAVQMLLAAGLPITDAQAEVERIQQRDVESAATLADATGDQDAVRRLLGLPPRTEDFGVSLNTVE